MSLIKCPECGKRDVSDSAEICPNCGFSIKEWIKKKEEEEIEAIKIQIFNEKVEKYKIEVLDKIAKENEEYENKITNKIPPFPKPSFIKEVLVNGIFSAVDFFKFGGKGFLMTILSVIQLVVYSFCLWLFWSLLIGIIYDGNMFIIGAIVSIITIFYIV